MQREAGNDFGFADRRMGLLEDSFAEREKALAGTVPSAVVIGSGAWAGQRDRLGDFLVVSVFTVSSLRLHPAIKRLDADGGVYMKQGLLPHPKKRNVPCKQQDVDIGFTSHISINTRFQANKSDCGHLRVSPPPLIFLIFYDVRCVCAQPGSSAVPLGMGIQDQSWSKNNESYI